jgi:hypothetical protein
MSAVMSDLIYGRPEDEWNVLANACEEFLLESARYKFLTSYTELNAVLIRRTGLPGFDFNLAHDRAAMGHLLGMVADRTFAESGLLISALCKFLNENGPGGGFFDLASNDEHRLLPVKATADQRLVFWSDQVAKLYEYYG